MRYIATIDKRERVVIPKEIREESKVDPLSFKPNSVISKRTVDLKGIVGKLREDGTLKLDMKKYNWWIRGIYNKNPLELRCPLYGDKIGAYR
ncbi:hypothetical protein [Saccharolobus islandicus]|uniref:hypothetical protein n=1 Tax=Saccharolobus islandicus TaxID=43080 RepID=UPI000376689F|nr:hypothetical protein [Sulfolobus islandicus]